MQAIYQNIRQRWNYELKIWADGRDQGFSEWAVESDWSEEVGVESPVRAS